MAGAISMIRNFCGVRFRRRSKSSKPFSEKVSSSNSDLSNSSPAHAQPPETSTGAESQDTEENHPQQTKELPLPPAKQLVDIPKSKSKSNNNNVVKKSASTRSLSSMSMKTMSLKLPRSMSLARRDREEKNNIQIKKKGKMKQEDSVWMKTIILGEKCKVPDEEEAAVIFDGKGKRVSAYHKKTLSSLPAAAVAVHNPQGQGQGDSNAIHFRDTENDKISVSEEETQQFS